MRPISQIRYCFANEDTQMYDRQYGYLSRGNNDIEDYHSCQTTQGYVYNESLSMLDVGQTQKYSDQIASHWKEETTKEKKHGNRRNMNIGQQNQIDWEQCQIELNAIRFRRQKDSLEEQQIQLEREWIYHLKMNQRRNYLLEDRTLKEFEEEDYGDDDEDEDLENESKQEQYNIDVQLHLQEINQQQEKEQKEILDDGQTCQIIEPKIEIPACCVVEKKKRGRKRKIIDSSLLNAEIKESESQLNKSESSQEQKDDEKNLIKQQQPEEIKPSTLTEDLESQINSSPSCSLITKNIQKFKIVVTKKLKSDQGTCQSKICGICLSDPSETTIGVIECSHEFCYDCILEWSKVTNRCPLCRAEFIKICKENQEDEEGLEKAVVVAPKKQKIPEDDPFYWGNGIDEICYICMTDYDKHQLIVCAHCLIKICHTYCDEKLLEDSLPDYDWFCHECRNKPELQQ